MRQSTALLYVLVYYISEQHYFLALSILLFRLYTIDYYIKSTAIDILIL
jgi:hypothetical protein